MQSLASNFTESTKSDFSIASDSVSGLQLPGHAQTKIVSYSFLPLVVREVMTCVFNPYHSSKADSPLYVAMPHSCKGTLKVFRVLI